MTCLENMAVSLPHHELRPLQLCRVRDWDLQCTQRDLALMLQNL
jgi:hypothetical protein